MPVFSRYNRSIFNRTRAFFSEKFLFLQLKRTKSDLMFLQIAQRYHITKRVLDCSKVTITFVSSQQASRIALAKNLLSPPKTLTFRLSTSSYGAMSSVSVFSLLYVCMSTIFSATTERCHSNTCFAILNLLVVNLNIVCRVKENIGKQCLKRP